MSAPVPVWSWLAFFGVGVGAAMGAWLRWAASHWLNPLWPRLPIGTLGVNLIGGLLIGAALAWFSRHPETHPAWRLFAVTGFLGGLTTFSAFSAESLTLIQRGDFPLAALHSGLHLFGSLAAAAIGYRWLHG